MKKVININFQGQVIAIEETAYEILKQYIESLKRYFAREEYGEEIVNDIESRIAELFGNRSKLGITFITDDDVRDIITSIGKPEDFDANYTEASTGAAEKFSSEEKPHHAKPEEKRSRFNLFRNTKDRVIAGVCSGLAERLSVDTRWVRAAFGLYLGLTILLFGQTFYGQKFPFLLFLPFFLYAFLWIVMPPKEINANIPKRRYRSSNNRFVAGVCSGLATFFNIDTWIVRMVFLSPLIMMMLMVVGTPSFGWWFLERLIPFSIFVSLFAYILLWIFTPQAKTVQQKMEMMGEDAYIQSIRDKVSDNVVYAKSKAVGDTEHKMPTPPSERPGCLTVLTAFFKVVFYAIIGIVGITLLVGITVFAFSGTHWLPLKMLWVDAGTETTWVIIAGILLLVVPLAAIITWVIRRSMKAKSRPVIGVVAFLLWISGAILAAVLVFSIASKWKVEGTDERNIAISPISSNRLYVQMLPYGNDFSVIGFGNITDIQSSFPFLSVNKDSLLVRNIFLQVRETSDTQFRVRTIAASRGRDVRSAQAGASQITYNIIQRDSLLLLPEFLSVPVSAGMRDQSVTIEILVPAGYSLEMCDRVSRFKNRWVPEAVRRRLRN